MTNPTSDRAALVELLRSPNEHHCCHKYMQQAADLIGSDARALAEKDTELARLRSRYQMALNKLAVHGSRANCENAEAHVTTLEAALRFMSDRVVKAIWPAEEDRGDTIRTAVKKADVALAQTEPTQGSDWEMCGFEWTNHDKCMCIREKGHEPPHRRGDGAYHYEWTDPTPEAQEPGE